MNLLKHLFSDSFRKHRWAARHLRLYRTFPVLLYCHKIQRRDTVIPKIVQMQYQYDMNKVMRGLIHIPKITNTKVEDI